MLELIAPLNDEETYQYEALNWLVYDDDLQLPIPETEADANTFIERYVFVSFYFATLKKSISWYNKLNFLSPTGVCDWHSEEIFETTKEKRGIMCDDDDGGGGGIPTSLRVGTFMTMT